MISYIITVNKFNTIVNQYIKLCMEVWLKFMEFKAVINILKVMSL